MPVLWKGSKYLSSQKFEFYVRLLVCDYSGFIVWFINFKFENLRVKTFSQLLYFQMGEQRPWGNCQREHNQKAGKPEPKAGLAVLSAPHLCPSIGRMLVLLPILWDEKHEVFFFLIFLFFNVIILYWFCHISIWICHRCTHVPHPEPSSLLPPCTIPLGRPGVPAPSIQFHASNLDWQLVSYMILYM